MLFFVDFLFENESFDLKLSCELNCEMRITLCISSIMGKVFQKKDKWEWRTRNFQGYQRNSKWDFQRLMKKEVESSKGDQGKIMCSFQGSWFFTLEFPRGVNTIL